MRIELLWNPLLLLERLGQEATRIRRLKRIRRTVARELRLGHLDSLELLELLASNAPQVVYDVGANVGTWTLLAKAIFPQCNVHAFEPLANHVTKFREHTARVAGVHLHEVALGSVSGKQVMHVTSLSDASSLLEVGLEMEQRFNVSEASQEQVAVERLDHYIDKNKVPFPDLIKLDVQGYEMEVLRGGERCLDHARAVISEVSFVEFYPKQCFFEDLVTFFSNRGFRLHAFGVGTSVGKQIAQTDVLFLRK
jgi:FkbM family methyltransferase